MILIKLKTTTNTNKYNYISVIITNLLHAVISIILYRSLHEL